MPRKAIPPRPFSLQYYYARIVFPQFPDKLVFSALTPNFLSLRTSPQTGVAIPRLEEKCIDNCPTERGNVAISDGNRYLVPFNRGIATPVCALARNDSIFWMRTRKHQFIGLLRERDKRLNCQFNAVILFPRLWPMGGAGPSF